MLNKQTQRILLLYFSVMITLHGTFLWKARNDVAIGLPDFSSSYTAVKILQEGHGRQLYDLGTQEAVQSSVVPVSVQRRRAVLPYNHPPFEAVLFLPLAGFSYLTAYWIWFAINLGLLIMIIITLRENLPMLGKMPFYLWASACLSFVPIFVALIQGQDSILLLFCFCMVFAAFRRNSDSRAGGWLGFGLFKFHIVLPFMVPFLLLRRSALLKSLFFVAVLLSLVGLIAVGWEGSSVYPRFVWSLNHNPRLHPLVGSEGTASLYGLISSLSGNKHPRLSVGLALTLSAGLLAVSTRVWAHRAKDQHYELALAANLLIALLISYHVWTHDLSVLLLALVLVLEEISSDSLLSRSWPRRLNLICVVLLWSPLYIILIHFRSLQLLATVLIVFLVSVLAGLSDHGGSITQFPNGQSGHQESEIGRLHPSC
jgi:hypothetical protein